MVESAIEIVNLRVVARGRRERPNLPPLSGAGGDALVGEREVYFEDAGRPLPTRIYNRDLLRPGQRIEGPAIVEEYATTTVLPPGLRIRAISRSTAAGSTAYDSTSSISAASHERSSSGTADKSARCSSTFSIPLVRARAARSIAAEPSTPIILPTHGASCVSTCPVPHPRSATTASGESSASIAC